MGKRTLGGREISYWGYLKRESRLFFAIIGKEVPSTFKGGGVKGKVPLPP